MQQAAGMWTPVSGPRLAGSTRMERFVIGLAFVMAGCTEHGSSPDANPDPCAGLGCASAPGTFTLTVLDSVTGQPVAGELSFLSQGQEVPFACTDVFDANTPCPSWQLAIEGTFDVTVSAAGYAPTEIQFTIEGPQGCCGIGPSTTDSLSLDPITN